MINSDVMLRLTHIISNDVMFVKVIDLGILFLQYSVLTIYVLLRYSDNKSITIDTFHYLVCSMIKYQLHARKV